MKKIIVLLVLSFFILQTKAQQTKLQGSRTWSFISSLRGKTFTEAQTLLKNNGMKMKEKYKDEQTNLDVYSFTAEKSDGPGMGAMYTIGCKDNKVSALMIGYEYDEDEIETILKKDREQIMKQLASSGFTNTESKKTQGLAEYKNKNGDLMVHVFTELEMASFTVIIGETKLVQQMNYEE